MGLVFTIMGPVFTIMGLVDCERNSSF